MLGLKCLFCVDKSISTGQPAEVNDAITLAVFAQPLTVAGQTILAAGAVPICQPCRTEQVGKPSGNGRLIVT